MASVANGIFGGELPWDMIGLGALIGVAVIIFDLILKAKKAPFRVPVLAAAIGIYLPLETMVPIFLGGLLNYLVTHTFGRGLTEEQTEKRNRNGMLFAAGLITGEALMGILMAIPIVAAGRGDVLALPAGLQIGGSMGEFAGLVILGAIALWLYRVGVRGGKTAD
jgi:putative OPT family oligopeptide transporter